MEAANDVNLKAVENITKICNLFDISLIHFSTDYVFDGNSSKPILEDNTKKPINYYGKTKHLGEEIIINKMKKYFIFRISWVYGLHGSNFPKTIIELTKTKTNLSVINDQIGCPTPTFLIVNVIKLILRDNDLIKKYGIYNLAPLGSTSWYEIAYQIYEYFADNPKCKLENIEPVKSTSYITKAKRPKYSVLDNNKIIKNFNLNFKKWDLYLKEFLSNISY
jgi:dTDP-4-dehydrorhamnose reductase